MTPAGVKGSQRRVSEAGGGAGETNDQGKASCHRNLPAVPDYSASGVPPATLAQVSLLRMGSPRFRRS